MKTYLKCLAVAVAAFCTTVSANAAVFQATIAGPLSDGGLTLDPLGATFDLADGASSIKRTSGLFRITYLDNTDGNYETTFAPEISVTSGSETIVKTGSVRLAGYNYFDVSGPLGASGLAQLVSDVVFEFSFGTFTLENGIISTNLIGITTGGAAGVLGTTNVKFAFLTGHFDAATLPQVPLPAGLPLLLGGLGLIRVLRVRKG